MSVSIKFKGFELVGDHIEYIIEVTNLATGEGWKFRRRYSYLRDFYEQLKSDSNHLKFPPKKLFGNKNPKFIESRRAELEFFFSEVCKIPRASEKEFFKTFVNPTDKILTSNPSIIEKPKTGQPQQSGMKLKVKEISTKVTDEISAKLFDLSTQPAPLDEEELKKQNRAYKTLSHELKISIRFGLPKCDDFNKDFLNSKVNKDDAIDRGFLLLGSNGLNVVGFKLTKFLE